MAHENRRQSPAWSRVKRFEIKMSHLLILRKFFIGQGHNCCYLLDAKLLILITCFGGEGVVRVTEPKGEY